MTLGAFIMVHPTQVAGADRLKPYYLANLIGNPLDTTIATACLIFGGVIERHPRDQVLHGARRRLCALPGGPLGARLARARGAQGESRRSRPTPRIKRFYFDTILHGQPALEFLVATFGAVAGDARQRLSVRHGHARMRAAGARAVDLRRRRATILSGQAMKLIGGAAGRAATRGVVT